jgi:hypothetical protein
MKHRAQPRKIVRSRSIRLGICVAAIALAGLPLAAGSTTSAAAGTATTGTSTTATSAGTTAKPRIFAYYYLWWSLDHWKSSLGSQYPTTSSPLPLPATLDASGCNPKSRYAGNVLTDVPSRLYSQDDPGFIEADVRQAAAAGLSGFMVNWAGSGAANQTVTSTPYSRRLQAMVDAVHKVNAEGIPFTLWLSYKASATVLSQSAIANDLSYFVQKYGNDPAFDRQQDSRPTVIWQGSRKYSVATLAAISNSFHGRLRILGDETAWSATRAPYLEGDAYYWSSQNPYSNPQSFQQLAALAGAVRSGPRNANGTVKSWIAPVIPGYDKQLAGGSSCVPRKGGQTLRTVFDGNLATHPDAWGLISWNEITEGSYVDPMTRYGMQDLTVLKSIVANGR